MSQLACPLCGRYVSLNIFDPSNFEDDIYAAQLTGLGRGRGFEVTDKSSVLHDPMVTGLIADRCFRILGLIYGDSVLPVEEGKALRATLESWIQYSRRLEEEKEMLMDELDEVDESEYDYSVERLLRKINREVSSEFEYLEDAIEFLLAVLTQIGVSTIPHASLSLFYSIYRP